jgi:hypothetical protein
MDPVVLDLGYGHASQGMHSSTVWLQDQPLPALLDLPQGSLVQQQQSCDSINIINGQWSLPMQAMQQQHAPIMLQDATSAAQLQLHGGEGTLLCLDGGLTAVLQDSSSLLSCMGSLLPVQLQQQQGINVTINGVPVVLQVQGGPPAGQTLMPAQNPMPAHQQLLQGGSHAGHIPMPAQQQLLPVNLSTGPQQGMQQVFITTSTPAAPQQMLLAGNNPVSLQTAHTLQAVQQQASSSPIASTSAGDARLHAQVQQLQEVVQQLSSQTAAVQRVLATQGSQAQAAQSPKTAVPQKEVSNAQGCLRRNVVADAVARMPVHPAHLRPSSQMCTLNIVANAFVFACAPFLPHSSRSWPPQP